MELGFEYLSNNSSERFFKNKEPYFVKILDKIFFQTKS